MTQAEQILKHLKRGSITPMEAYDKYQITCLSERIRDLRDKDYDIESTMESKNGKRYARHRLVS